MSLSQLVNVNIALSAAGLTGPSFGIPMYLGYHTHYVDVQRTYTSLAGMVSDGFSTTEPAYLMAQVGLSQSPQVTSWIVGRRSLPPTQTLALTVTSAAVGTIYAVTVNNTPVTYTVPSGSPTTTTVATAIAALIGAVTGVTAAAAVAVITITATAGPGHLVNLSDWTSNLTLTDTTADPGVATDLAAINAVNPSWYSLALDSNSSAEILAAAAWVEANTKIFGANNSDTENGVTSNTTSVMYHLKNSDYTRTTCLHAQSELLSWGGLSWANGQIVTTPGSSAWSYKSLPGVPADNLTATQYSAILANNGNVYIPLTSNGANLGANVTLMGTSGAGEFMDIVQFIDWLVSEIQINLASLLVNSPKVPYTDAGVDLIKSVIQAVLVSGVNAGGLAATPAPTVSAPLVANVSANDKANRNLPSVTFSATLAGAINTLTINGAVTV